MDAETLAKLVHEVENVINYDPEIVGDLHLDDEGGPVEWSDVTERFHRTMTSACERVLENLCHECAGPLPCVCTRDE